MNLFYNHILIEAYCTKDEEVDCPLKKEKICIDCFSNECSYLSYTEAPNEITITDQNGVSVYGIGFGGDMETNEVQRKLNLHLWEKICKSKIREAYAEYMKQRDNESNNR